MIVEEIRIGNFSSESRWTVIRILGYIGIALAMMEVSDIFLHNKNMN